MIYGSIGLFRKWIPLPSSMLALSRAVIGMLFLVVLTLAMGKKVDFDAVKKNAKPLIFAGALLGFNWMLLFEAYNYTSVATATLCYYMAPIFMILASRLLFNERVSTRKWICIIIALAGMVLVTGVAESGFSGAKGIVLGLVAAVMYAWIVMNNKQLKDISSYDRTIVQLFISALLLIPYVLITENVASFDWNTRSIIFVLILGIVHTGIAYALYFGNVGKLPTHEVALLSYIDPVLAVILSATVLKEGISTLGIIGTVMVIAALIASEVDR